MGRISSSLLLFGIVACSDSARPSTSSSQAAAPAATTVTSAALSAVPAAPTPERYTDPRFGWSVESLADFEPEVTFDNADGGPEVIRRRVTWRGTARGDLVVDVWHDPTAAGLDAWLGRVGHVVMYSGSRDEGTVSVGGGRLAGRRWSVPRGQASEKTVVFVAASTYVFRLMYVNGEGDTSASAFGRLVDTFMPDAHARGARTSTTGGPTHE